MELNKEIYNINDFKSFSDIQYFVNSLEDLDEEDRKALYRSLETEFAEELITKNMYFTALLKKLDITKAFVYFSTHDESLLTREYVIKELKYCANDFIKKHELSWDIDFIPYDNNDKYNVIITLDGQEIGRLGSISYTVRRGE